MAVDHLLFDHSKFYRATSSDSYEDLANFKKRITSNKFRIPGNTNNYFLEISDSGNITAYHVHKGDSGEIDSPVQMLPKDY